MASDMIRGISVCNPVDLDPQYFMDTVIYAIEHNLSHIQFIGPIHDYLRGNIDGITPYRKYAEFNPEKDEEYVALNLDYLNAGCKKAADAGIKMYMWHHELDLPDAFTEKYPEVLNADGDIEVTHPLVRDFLENRIEDFFFAYPYMHGIILTLHETKVPLLKLKNQKLDKVERVKYVTKILYDTCLRLGKELIVRPFASIEKDYEMMTEAYESISKDLVIMDKWTQFDWSLCLPHNRFFHKIKSNPLLVETDIFGEYFGKGQIPLMLKEHIREKFQYCEGFKPAGYANRIDRAGQHFFGSPNMVNLEIMNAYMQGEDAEEAIDRFFEKTYPGAGGAVREIMEPTEDILRSVFWLKGYYFSELSAFPRINHCKNHFYFEMMRDNFEIASGEWFIPKDWQRGSLESVLSEKADAAEKADACFEKLLSLKDKLEKEAFHSLYVRFGNLKYVARLWEAMTKAFMYYSKYFETRDEKYVLLMEEALSELLRTNQEGIALFGKEFYSQLVSLYSRGGGEDYVEAFAKDMRENLRVEKNRIAALEAQKNLVDYIVCGGGTEGHKLQKEVNFSDTFVKDDSIYRIPGTGRGAAWSTVNTHGWFSYEIKTKPHAENTILLEIGPHLCEDTDIKVNVDGTEYVFREKTGGKKTTVTIPYYGEKEYVRIRFDRFTKNTPCVHSISVISK
ncbi:MAG: hypothetical protein IJN74_06535 [Clostridia bacterium]|nr:hypothetical protein [Clostridia bacterium]